MKARTATLAGSVVGGFVASVCCIMPLAFAFLGLSGAAFAVRLEPMRAYFLVLTYGLLAGAFYLTYRPATACGPDGACTAPPSRATGKLALWITTVVVLLTTMFPLYSPYLL